MHIYKKKLNRDHVYMLVVTLIALCAVLFAASENHDKNTLRESYERELQVQDNTYLELQDKYKKVSDQLKIITNEYHELYQSGQ